MIIHHEEVRKAHEEDDLLFGTVESWIVYVRSRAFAEHIILGLKAMAASHRRARWGFAYLGCDQRFEDSFIESPHSTMGQDVA